MKKISFHSILLLLFSVFMVSCTPSESQKATTISSISYKVIDSIPLFNDSLAFRFVNPRKIKEGKILAWQYPLLNLSLLDDKGKFVKEISRKGKLPKNFKSIFISPIWGENDNLYVIEEGHLSQLNFFDQNYNFLTSVRLFQDSKYDINAIDSFISIDEASEDSLNIITTVDGGGYHKYDKRRYEKLYTIAHISVKDRSKVTVDFHMPYNKISSLKELLENNIQTWASHTALLTVGNDKIYVKFDFDDFVYVLDKDFNKLGQINIRTKYQRNTYTTPLTDKITNRNKRLAINYKLKYSNGRYYHIDIWDDFLFLVYRKPVPDHKIPETPQEEQKNQYTLVLHVKNLDTNEDYSMDLPAFLSDYTKVYPIEKDVILAIGDEKLSEDLYLYKIKLSYE